MMRRESLSGIRIFIYLIFYSLFLSIPFSCQNEREKDRITASGTIEAVSIDVASKISGQVKEILVEQGSRVKTGETLAVIDHSTLDIQLKQADAGVKLAEAQLELLRKGARLEDIHQAEEGLKQAETQLKVAKEDAERIQELASKGSATQKQKDDAEARQAIALAQYNSAKEALKKFRQLARPEEIKAAESRLAQAKAAVDLLQKTIADCTITAPSHGVVTHRPVEEGEFIIQGSTLLTIARLDMVYVMVYLTEKELGHIRLQQQAEVRIDARPDKVFYGTITYISPEAEFTPKNIQTKEERIKLVFAVKIEIDNPERILKPGMPADAAIQIDKI